MPCNTRVGSAQPVPAAPAVLSGALVDAAVGAASVVPDTLAEGAATEDVLETEVMAMDVLVTVTEVALVAVDTVHVAVIDVVAVVDETVVDVPVKLELVDERVVDLVKGHRHGQNCSVVAMLQSATWHHASSAQAVEPVVVTIIDWLVVVPVRVTVDVRHEQGQNSAVPETLHSTNSHQKGWSAHDPALASAVVRRGAAAVSGGPREAGPGRPAPPPASLPGSPPRPGATPACAPLSRGGDPRGCAVSPSSALLAWTAPTAALAATGSSGHKRRIGCTARPRAALPACISHAACVHLQC
mmetsp:Transcript_22570/g.64118  ORF Transcript_22570/g.64118 Transcript_22570/m.64118 type:complete len:299 (-) Transcript_22570:29-925(-)